LAAHPASLLYQGGIIREGLCWSATAPADTSSEAKEAFNFNKIRLGLGSH
jgi:hypothetical protein